MTVQYSVLTHTRDVTLVHKKGKMEAHVYKSTRKLRSIIITLKGEFTQITKYHILSGGKWYYFDDAHRKAETSDTTTTADETKTVCMATAHNAAVRKKVFIFGQELRGVGLGIQKKTVNRVITAALPPIKFECTYCKLLWKNELTKLL